MWTNQPKANLHILLCSPSPPLLNHVQEEAGDNGDGEAEAAGAADVADDEDDADDEDEDDDEEGGLG